MPVTEYALKIRKSDMALIQFLNDGEPRSMPKKTTYLIFEVADESASITTKMMTEREFGNTYDISTLSPLLLKLKKYK